MQKKVAEGELIPWGWGIAWLDYARCVAICYPIPFNILAARCRRLYFRFARAAHDRAIKDAFEAGVEVGRAGKDRFWHTSDLLGEAESLVDEVQAWLDGLGDGND